MSILATDLIKQYYVNIEKHSISKNGGAVSFQGKRSVLRSEVFSPLGKTSL